MYEKKRRRFLLQWRTVHPCGLLRDTRNPNPLSSSILGGEIGVSAVPRTLKPYFQTVGVMLQCLHWHLPHTPVTCSTRRQHAGDRYLHRKRKPKDSTDQSVQIVIDTSHLPHQVSSSLKKLFQASQSKLHHFAVSSKEAFEDLQTLVTVDCNRRILISCRQSTLEFVGHLILWACVIIVGFRVLGKLGLAIHGQFGFGHSALVRRDRSLAGREVIVAKKKMGFLASGNPLSLPYDTLPRTAERVPRQVKVEEKLPRWWLDTLPRPVVTVNKEEYQMEAKRLVQAITESRMSGRDISEDDIIQLRRICRISGARVFFDTVNTRKSFYRAAVDFVLNVCSRATIRSTYIQIDGEDPPQFVVGLAGNIRLESVDAARIISAAVAARTRSCFLQAWALKMQGKYSEAVMELSKICVFHKIFPPEESSPEMEMVALGLGKQLQLEQREFLMDMLVKICGECHRSAAEALGLMLPAEGSSSQYKGHCT